MVHLWRAFLVLSGNKQTRTMKRGMKLECLVANIVEKFMKLVTMKKVASFLLVNQFLELHQIGLLVVTLL